jgi:C1A family cysteine protease
MVIDYRPHQSAVRNQGNRPTCVGFAVSAAHEWMAQDAIMRSPEDVIWAGHQEGGPAATQATSVRLALAGLQAHQHASEEAWPYGNPPWPAPRPPAAMLTDNQRTLPVWRQLSAITFSTVQGELAQGNAVILTLRVVYTAWRQPGGVIDADPGRRTPDNHAVLAVGIQTSADGATQRVIVKNSWGENWGNRGYGYVSRPYLETYGVRAHVLEQRP